MLEKMEPTEEEILEMEIKVQIIKVIRSWRGKDAMVSKAEVETSMLS